MKYKTLILLLVMAVILALIGIFIKAKMSHKQQNNESVKSVNVKEPLGSSVNIPVDKREGNASIVYFTRDLSPKGLEKIYKKVNKNMVDNVAPAYAKFVPAIDSFLKEHLFADIFARGVLTNQEREIATVSALSSLAGVEGQLNAHIGILKNTGFNQEQVDEILLLTSWLKNNMFGLGEKNEAYTKYFIGQSYLNPLNSKEVNISNVTFEPRCRNNWHIHHKGGQILLVTDGRGYYQEWGKPARELKAGDVVYIAPEIKHWHGASRGSWFAHIAMSVPTEGASTEWLEEVSDKEYNKLK